MAFPIIPFAAGVAVGSLVTYGYKERQVQERVMKWAQGTYAWLGNILHRIPGRSKADTGTVEEPKEEIILMREEEGTDRPKEAAPEATEETAAEKLSPAD